MSDDLIKEADRRLEESLERTGARDPREFYREQLRELKGVNPNGYEDAVAYYRTSLIPEIASGSVDPVAAWTEYGRRIATALAPGRTVTVDGSGRALPYEAPPPPDRLILHLPDDKGASALLVGLPPEPTLAQHATYDVLVSRRQKLAHS
jgi:hypothetical protein